MEQYQLELEGRLLALRDEIKALEKSGLPIQELKPKLIQLRAERNKLEDELLDLVVDPSNDYHVEAREGLREGLHSAMQGIADSLKHETTQAATAPNKSKAKKEGWLTQKFRILAQHTVLSWVATFGFIYLLLIAVAALGSGFNDFFGGREAVQELFAFATNPFMGLLMGLLGTAIIQSSSVTTSIIVALCVGGLPIATAIPMVMGANIGTSVTNTLVSLGHIGHRREFRRAFAAATIHDCFNITAVLLFLPLEMCFHFLEKLSNVLAQGLFGEIGGLNLKSLNILGQMTKPVEAGLHQLFKLIPGSEKLGEGLYILFGLALIFFSILLLGLLLRILFTGRAEKVFRKTVNRGGLSAIGSGFVITTLVQSSSTTTSLIVPLAGAGLLRLKQAYPFTLGANIGTCVTALLAAFAITGEGAQLGLQIAFVHLLFNGIGVLFIYGIPFLRNIPLVCAASLAKLASIRRPLAIIYILFVFFIVPLIGLGIYRLFQ